MAYARTENRFHGLFRIGVLVKGIDGTVEMIVGAFLWFLSPHMLNSVMILLAGDELSEEPRDVIWNSLAQAFRSFTGSARYFWALLLVAHGIVKLIFVVGLWKNKIWIYPFAIAAFGIFILYQIHSIFINPSLFVEILTFFDIFIVLLIVNEYQHVRRSR